MERVVSQASRARTRAILAGALVGLASLAAPAGAAEVDLTGGVLAYRSFDTLANTLTVSLTGGTYTIDDPTDTAIVPTSNALGAGCAAFDSNTVTCPAAAVTSLDIDTRIGDDSIVLAGVAHPALVRGGQGTDTFVGGTEDDTFQWSPGDGSDTVDGGAGHDTVLFNASNANESIDIAEDGPDFDLFRDIGAVHLHASGFEDLQLFTVGGTDRVVTTPLVDTTQEIVDGDDALLDTFIFNAAGHCAFLNGDTFDVLGRQPVQFSGFPTVQTADLVCGGIVDLQAGVLTYSAMPLVANALTVSLANAAYSIHDTGEVAVSITRSAFEQGCASVDASTVTCPEPAVTSFTIDTRDGEDSIVLTGVVDPALVHGGQGNDTIVGGSAGDTFLWAPGDGSDTIDGGPGADTLAFSGSNISEIYTIAPDGEGFVLTRNIANILMHVQNTETLALDTRGGADDVSTTNLLGTTQMLTTVPDASPDTLRVDAVGLCLVRQNDTFAMEGRQPIQFSNFADVFVSNAFCRPDPCDGAVASQGCRVNGVRDQPCEGTSGDDVIVGTKAGDVILGGGGNDRIAAGDGDDLVCGDAGDDLLIGGAGNDTLAGGPGNDRLKGGGGGDILLGGDDADQLAGGSGIDDLDGGAGDDRLRGGGDGDTLRGGLGDDLVDGGGAQDFCTDPDQVGPFVRCELP